MNSRQRVEAALNHQQPDRVPLDLGASPVTGMHVSSVYKLRQALKLDPPGTPVKVTEAYQMLGEIAPDLQEVLGVDVVGLGGAKSFFGFQYRDWKPWTTFDGTPVLVPGGFNTQPEPNGDILMYPEGDRSVPPSGRMPKGGFYFDTIVRQEPIDDAKLNVEDNLQEFGPISDEMLAILRRRGRPPAARERPGNSGQFRRHGLRRHRPGARPLAEEPQGHPRHRRVVHEHGQPLRLRLRAVPPPVRHRLGESGEDLRRRGRPGVGGVHYAAPISARRAGRSSAPPPTESSISRSTAG